jgi:hypothetical protein
MDNLYERIFELLGKTPRHRVVRKFLREISEVPSIENRGFMRTYNFARHGFFIEWNVHTCIWLIGFYFGDPNGFGDDFHGWSNFASPLHNGIVLGDSRSEVRKKMGRKPDGQNKNRAPFVFPWNLSHAEVKELCIAAQRRPFASIADHYDEDGFTLSFDFTIGTGQLIRILLMK